MAKKFKRYYTGHDNGKPGKGSWQREAQVAEQQVANNWCQTFGHRQGTEVLRDYEISMDFSECLSCGALIYLCPICGKHHPENIHRD